MVFLIIFRKATFFVFASLDSTLEDHFWKFIAFWQQVGLSRLTYKLQLLLWHERPQTCCMVQNVYQGSA